jgi:hypothetical protein
MIFVPVGITAASACSPSAMKADSSGMYLVEWKARIKSAPHGIAETSPPPLQAVAFRWGEGRAIPGPGISLAGERSRLCAKRGPRLSNEQDWAFYGAKYDSPGCD